MITEEQLKNRRIGASSMAACAGVSRYRTMREEYEVLVGNVDTSDIGRKVNVRLGNHVESFIFELFREQHPDLIVDNNWVCAKTFEDPGPRGWVTVHLDSAIVDSAELPSDPQAHIVAPLEIKKVGHRNARFWGESGSGAIDIEHLPQVMMQMYVTETDQAYVAALIGDDDFRWYRIERDDEVIEMLLESGDDMWRRVREKDPPPIDYDHASALPLIKRLYPDVSGETIDLPETVVSWYEVAKDASELRDRWAAVCDAAKARVLDAMGNAAIGKMPNGYEYTRKTIFIPERVQDAYEYVRLDVRKTRKSRGSKQ